MVPRVLEEIVVIEWPSVEEDGRIVVAGGEHLGRDGGLGFPVTHETLPFLQEVVCNVRTKTRFISDT